MTSGFRAVAYAELPVDVAEVNLHGHFADEELEGYLSVRMSIRYELKYFSLALS